MMGPWDLPAQPFRRRLVQSAIPLVTAALVIARAGQRAGLTRRMPGSRLRTKPSEA